MKLLKEEIFICLDCETTGLNLEKDRIIEIAVIKFNFKGILGKMETLIDPKCIIPKQSQDIHNISDEMVLGKPTIKEILPDYLKFIGDHIIVGHGIKFDINLICKEAEKNNIPCSFDNMYIDTLRLARLYGECSVNSLESLRKHFNIEQKNPHRAYSDASINIEIFKNLSKKFKTLNGLISRLKNPILMKNMPLGQYKGRRFSEIPLDYLKWALRKNFDQDLLYSIKTEIKNRKDENNFQKASSPFLDL
ncbi:MAG: DNA polymerase III subunit epsilon [Chlamydiae bacterium SM23_39]|nr:MAG: DNA polymerase III subunit epsilon [Chlamydiae bacterium SM23_39]